MIYNSVAEIYEAIDKTRVKLLEQSKNLSESNFDLRENEQGWSVAEIIEHVTIVEGGLVKIIEKLLPQAESEGVKSDGTLNPPISFVEIVKEAADKKFEAPVMVHPKGTQTVGESLTKLQDIQQKLNELRPRLEAVDLSNTAFPHPSFGKLNLYQWLIVIGLHERRHLAQINRILENTN